MNLVGENPLEVIDVTLRDGGYLNDWHFPEHLMQRVVSAVDAAGVHFTEVGNLGGDDNAGLAARCPVELLARIHTERRDVGLAVMLRPDVSEALELLEPRAHYLSLVRMPTVVSDVNPAVECARIAASLGVPSSANLTNVSAFSEAEVLKAIELVERSGAVTCLYLADSRGSMRPDDVTSIVTRAREIWSGRLGFHAHDNIGFALENSAVSLQAGCDMVDGSLRGYGIGGQNTDLLELLDMLSHDGHFHGEFDHLRALADEIQLDMPPEGLPLYRLAGEKNIKQEWVPPMVRQFGPRTGVVLGALSSRRYLSIDEMWMAIDTLLAESNATGTTLSTHGAERA